MKVGIKQIVLNLMKCCPVVVTHRDGTREIYSLLCQSADRNFYVFKYPFIACDTGREVNPKYVSYQGLAANVYLFCAAKMMERFPRWVTF